MEATKVGIIGCGNISGIYLENLSHYDATDLFAVADLDTSRAQAKADEFKIPHVLTVDEMLAHPEIEIVVDLTIPAAHYDVAKLALNAGKHVYNEKPLSIGLYEGRELVDLAASKGVRLGCAPDTVLGAGIQTCRELIDGGELGEIVGFNAFMMSSGVEGWHPNPTFYYQVGGGPLYDMGPYYVSALVQLLGPVARVSGITRTSFSTRTVTSQPLAGSVLSVETPTHIVSTLEFAKGPIGQLTTSFDTMAGTELKHIEIYGSKATLRVPDPNFFGGPITIKRVGSDTWEEIEITRPYAENSRGLGVLDMALAIRHNRPHRASGDLAYHVLDVMHATHLSSDESRHIRLDSGVAQPALMPAALLTD